MAIGNLILSGHPPEPFLGPIERLTHDPVTAVRAQAVFCLVALLRSSPSSAVRWFVESTEQDDVLLRTRFVEQFIVQAVYQADCWYEPLRPVILRMLASNNSTVVQTAARMACKLALSAEIAEKDAQFVRTNPSSLMRETAAKTYAQGASDKTFGEACVTHLVNFLSDADDNVRRGAVAVFERVGDIGLSRQARMLNDFLNAKPGHRSLARVLNNFEQSRALLPDQVGDLLEYAVHALSEEGGNVRSGVAIAGRSLARLTLRLYGQTKDEKVKRRCLNQLDLMIEGSFFGLDTELEKVER
jgi:hypothetical protein